MPGSLHIFVSSFFVKATKIPNIGCEIFISMCSFFAFCKARQARQKFKNMKNNEKVNKLLRNIFVTS